MRARTEQGGNRREGWYRQVSRPEEARELARIPSHYAIRSRSRQSVEFFLWKERGGGGGLLFTYVLHFRLFVHPIDSLCELNLIWLTQRPIQRRKKRGGGFYLRQKSKGFEGMGGEEAKNSDV